MVLVLSENKCACKKQIVALNLGKNIFTANVKKNMIILHVSQMEMSNLKKETNTESQYFMW